MSIRQVPLSKPDIGLREIELVNQVLRSTSLSMGPMVKQFEEDMARWVGVKHGVAVSSGTCGLHLLVRACGIGEGDEVITSAFSFIASSNCILFEGARPVFADILPASLNLDPDQVEARITPKTKAIIAVDVFGHPAEWDALTDIARRHNLVLIEDSCEALGATYKGRQAGSFGTAGVFGFYPNKQITTGEGGMIVTHDDELAAQLRSMRNQGRGDAQQWLEHVRLGYNYRLDEMSAALGVAQMERLPDILARRERVARLYTEALADIPEVELPQEASDVTISWFVYVIRLAKHLNRERVMEELAERGVATRPYFNPLHLQPFYREFGHREGELPITEEIGGRTIAIPFHNDLSEDEIQYVTQCIRQAVRRAR